MAAPAAHGDAGAAWLLGEEEAVERAAQCVELGRSYFGVPGAWKTLLQPDIVEREPELEDSLGGQEFKRPSLGRVWWQTCNPSKLGGRGRTLANSISAWEI